MSSSKHNAKKITTRVRGPFHQSITANLAEEKREEKQFTEPTHVVVYLFWDLDRGVGVCVGGGEGGGGQHSRMCAALLKN